MTSTEGPNCYCGHGTEIHAPVLKEDGTLSEGCRGGIWVDRFGEGGWRCSCSEFTPVLMEDSA